MLVFYSPITIQVSDSHWVAKVGGHLRDRQEAVFNNNKPNDYHPSLVQMFSVHGISHKPLQYETMTVMCCMYVDVLTCSPVKFWMKVRLVELIIAT